MLSTHYARASQPSPVSYSPNDLVTGFDYLRRRGARKFLRDGLERCDLEQVAALGLIKAAHRYDAGTQTPFEAYAWIVIVGELMHYVRDHERIVRLPRRLHELERPFARAFESLVAEYGREPTDRELADRLDVHVPAIAELRAARTATVAVPIDGPASRALDRAEAAGWPVDDRLLVADAFAALESIERRVIVGMYVLGLTQLELGRRLSLSAKRVSRIHRRALRTMRTACAS